MHQKRQWQQRRRHSDHSEGVLIVLWQGSKEALWRSGGSSGYYFGGRQLNVRWGRLWCCKLLLLLLFSIEEVVQLMAITQSDHDSLTLMFSTLTPAHWPLRTQWSGEMKCSAKGTTIKQGYKTERPWEAPTGLPRVAVRVRCVFYQISAFSDHHLQHHHAPSSSTAFDMFALLCNWRLLLCSGPAAHKLPWIPPPDESDENYGPVGIPGEI